MVWFWTVVTVFPLAALVAGMIMAPRKTLALGERFFASRPAALVLTVIGWAWTAYECDTIGIDVFDSLLKRFPGELWILAAVLAFLTFIWLPKNLPVRALSGIFMLLPAEALKATRPLVPASGFAAVQLLVAVFYLYAVVGMYGMFYPWRLETALRKLCKRS